METWGDLVFVPLGGSTLDLWVSRLRHLRRPEFHLCDRDNAPPAPEKYADFVAEVNRRPGCHAVSTRKRELENYLHPDAIREAYAQEGTGIALPASFGDFDDVPLLVAQALHAARGGRPWAELDPDKQRKKVSADKYQVKRRAAGRMTVARLAETDPQDEIRGWLTTVAAMMADGAA